jgi:hypothetical protein
MRLYYKKKKNNSNKSNWYDGLIIARMRMLRHGQSPVTLTLLQPGNISVFLGKQEAIDW